MRWIESRRSAFRAYLKVGLLLAPLLTSAQAVPAAVSAPAASPGQPRFLVVIDPAHGGEDDGARLGSHLLEKNLVLALSQRLHSILNEQGISVVTTRDSDINLSATSRAETANHAGAAACITLHATASGVGIHLFTSSLTPISLTRFLPWDTSQAGYTVSSLRLSSEINSAMARAEVPVTLGRTALEPLDSFTCPAVAVELAPKSKETGSAVMSDSDYQNQIASALAAAIEQWQRDWRQQP